MKGTACELVAAHGRGVWTAGVSVSSSRSPVLPLVEGPQGASPTGTVPERAEEEGKPHEVGST